MATRISSLPFATIKNVELDRKKRAELIKKIAESEGVTVRTVQRRFTNAAEKRGQDKNLTLKAANAVKHWFADNPVTDEKVDGTSHDKLLMQERYSTQQAARDRAREMEDFVDDPEEEQDDKDMYPGSIFESARRVQTIYVPQGGKYTEGRIYQKDPKDWATLTAPAGGTWIVRVYN